MTKPLVCVKCRALGRLEALGWFGGLPWYRCDNCGFEAAYPMGTRGAR